MKPPTEKVLCFPTWKLNHLGVFQGLSMDPKYLTLTTAFHLHQFIDREDAETNPEWKQIIPYVLVVHSGSILTYARGKSGGEDRLHAKLSVGVGGHISEQDGEMASEEESPHLPDAYWNGLHREVREEIGATGEVIHVSNPVGFLNDESSPVGRVHFGVVHIMTIQTNPTETSMALEHSLEDARFIPIHHAPSLSDLESWSRYCMDSPELLKMLEEAAR